jgi:hypothetical protein
LSPILPPWIRHRFKQKVARLLLILLLPFPASTKHLSKQVVRLEFGVDGRGSAPDDAFVGYLGVDAVDQAAGEDAIR